jgi:hypothetical protein
MASGPREQPVDYYDHSIGQTNMINPTEMKAYLGEEFDFKQYSSKGQPGSQNNKQSPKLMQFTQRPEELLP